MRIFCPPTLFPTSLHLSPVSGPGASSTPTYPTNVGRSSIASETAPLFTCRGSPTLLRSSMSPARSLAALKFQDPKLIRTSKMRPDAPLCGRWSYACTKSKPGVRQPEQYALRLRYRPNFGPVGDGAGHSADEDGETRNSVAVAISQITNRAGTWVPGSADDVS